MEVRRPIVTTAQRQSPCCMSTEMPMSLRTLHIHICRVNDERAVSRRKGSDLLTGTAGHLPHRQGPLHDHQHSLKGRLGVSIAIVERWVDLTSAPTRRREGRDGAGYGRNHSEHKDKRQCSSSHNTSISRKAGRGHTVYPLHPDRFLIGVEDRTAIRRKGQ
jgi:hypothetical protein